MYVIIITLVSYPSATMALNARQPAAAQCGIAPGEWTRVPRQGAVDSPFRVVAGMMVMRLGQTTLEAMLLERSLRSWIPMAAAWLEVLVVRECHHGRSHHPPPWLAERYPHNSTLASLHWHCFPRTDTRQQLGQNYARLGLLFRAMHDILPQRDYYLKVDADTLVSTCHTRAANASLPRL